MTTNHTNLVLHTQTGGIKAPLATVCIANWLQSIHQALSQVLATYLVNWLRPIQHAQQNCCRLYISPPHQHFHLMDNYLQSACGSHSSSTICRKFLFPSPPKNGSGRLRNNA